MKRNDVVELRTKGTDELRRMLLDLREEVARLATQDSIDQASGKTGTKNTNAVKNKRRDIARVLTFLSMKQEVEVVKPTEEKTEAEGKSTKKKGAING